MTTDALRSERHPHPTLPYHYGQPFDLRVGRQLELYERGHGRVNLISCAAQKLECRAPARQLYRSPLFRKAAMLAEATAMDWGILSAEHGLVLPDQVLDPYDRTLSDLSRDERTAWHTKVLDQVTSRWGEHRSFWIYSGRGYLRFATRLSTTFLPLHRLGIGERLKNLTSELPTACERAIHGEHAWLFQDSSGNYLPGNATNQPTARRALESYTRLYPHGFPWETHFNTRSLPSPKEINPEYATTTTDPILFRRRIFAKATGLTLPSEPQWLTSATPELESTC